MNAFTKPTVKAISWAEASKQKDDPRLFLVNLSGKIVFMTVPITGSNERLVLRMPSTWIPVDMAVECERHDILRSSALRSLVERGEVGIADTEAAEELFLTNPLVQMERQRLMIAQGSDTIELDGQKPSTPDSVPEPELRVTDALGEGNAVNPRVLDLVLKNNEGARSDDDTMMLMLNLSGMSVADVRYVLANSKSEKLRQFAASQNE